MKNISRHVGKLELIKRLPNSVNGNPRYLLYCAGVSFKTTVDSSYGDSVPNDIGKECEVTVGTHYNTCQLYSYSVLRESK